MASTPSEELMLFEFHPPFTDAHIESVRSAVLESIPAYEVLKRQYFESSFSSLLDYAVHYKKQTKNFSISVGRFMQDFDPQRTDEKEAWKEDNIWVKVRVLGGVGDAFRSRFMATHFGLAKIDWKRKTFRSIKKKGAKLAATLESVVTIGSTAPGHAESVVQVLGRREKLRASQRVTSVKYTPKQVFEQVATASLGEIEGIVDRGDAVKLAELVFQGLVGADRTTITRAEAVEFAASASSLDSDTAGFIFDQTVKGSEASNQQFYTVFLELIKTQIATRECKRGEVCHD